MADTKISALTELLIPAGTEQLVVAPAGANKRITTTNFKKYTQFWNVQAFTEGDSPADAPATLSEQIYTNTAAGATVQIILPPTPTLGMVVDFAVTAAHNFQIVASGTQIIKVGAAASTAGGTFTSSTLGSYLQIRYVAADLWQGISSGTWVAA